MQVAAVPRKSGVTLAGQPARKGGVAGERQQAIPMALAPSVVTAQQPELEPAPLLLPWDLRLTPEQFERVCQAIPEVVLELAADGHLIAMTPMGGETGSQEPAPGPAAAALG